MKILIILLINTFFIIAEPMTSPIDIGTMVEGIGKMYKNSGGQLIRYVTDTQNEKEKCNRAWWDYFKSTGKTISILSSENKDIERLLRKRNIKYSNSIRMATRSIKINIDKIRKLSCSKSYFEQKIQKDKRIKTLYAENKELNRLLNANGLHLERNIYYKEKKTIKVKKRKRARAKEDLEVELLKAINDVN